MFCSILQPYILTTISEVSWWHVVIFGLLSLALSVFLLNQGKHSMYGIIVLGITVYFSLILLDLTVLNRLGSSAYLETGFSLSAEYQRLLQGGTARWIEMVANVIAFVPFGFFLSEFLATTNRFGSRHRVGRVALCAFGLSMCIESLQLILYVGVCEVTDLVMNTVGGVVGASLALLVRSMISLTERQIVQSSMQ